MKWCSLCLVFLRQRKYISIRKTARKHPVFFFYLTLALQWTVKLINNTSSLWSSLQNSGIGTASSMVTDCHSYDNIYLEFSLSCGIAIKSAKRSNCILVCERVGLNIFFKENPNKRTAKKEGERKKRGGGGTGGLAKWMDRRTLGDSWCRSASIWFHANDTGSLYLSSQQLLSCPKQIRLYHQPVKNQMTDNKNKVWRK